LIIPTAPRRLPFLEWKESADVGRSTHCFRTLETRCSIVFPEIERPGWPPSRGVYLLAALHDMSRSRR
jgi:hypothetical protein